MFIRIGLAAAVLLTAACPSIAAQKGTGLQSIGMLNGTCMHLVIMGKDSTATCKGVVANTAYNNGRSGFYFVTNDGATVTFSGMGSRQIKQGPDTAVQPIDMLIFSYKGNTDKANGVGTCKFSNPNKGPAPLQCSVETKYGKFEANFMTDGRAPDFTHF